MENAIKFQQEASNWNEALPIGNGTLGAMAFGGVREERIQLLRVIILKFENYCNKEKSAKQKN